MFHSDVREYHTDCQLSRRDHIPFSTLSFNHKIAHVGSSSEKGNDVMWHAWIIKCREGQRVQVGTGLSFQYSNVNNCESNRGGNSASSSMRPLTKLSGFCDWVWIRANFSDRVRMKKLDL